MRTSILSSLFILLSNKLFAVQANSTPLFDEGDNAVARHLRGTEFLPKNHTIECHYELVGGADGREQRVIPVDCDPGVCPEAYVVTKPPVPTRNREWHEDSVTHKPTLQPTPLPTVHTKHPTHRPHPTRDPVRKTWGTKAPVAPVMCPSKEAKAKLEQMRSQYDLAVAQFAKDYGFNATDLPPDSMVPSPVPTRPVLQG